MIKLIMINAAIIKVLNSCDRKVFVSLVDQYLGAGQFKVFYKKWYLWNIVRGRDYYKMMSHYVITKLQDTIDPDSSQARAEFIINMVIETAKTEEIKKSFIWAIMKQIPLLTAITIQYASPEKIKSLLYSDKILITDTAITPFVMTVSELRRQVSELEKQLEVTQEMI